MSATNIFVDQYNFKSKCSSSSSSAPITSSNYHPSNKECPWRIVKERVLMASVVCMCVSLAMLAVFYPYQRLNACYGVDWNYYIQEYNYKDTPAWFRENCIKLRSDWRIVGVLELLTVVMLLGLFWNFAAEFILFMVKHCTNAYNIELAARMADPQRGQFLQQYLRSIIPSLAQITEIEEINVDQQGLHLIPPYPVLSPDAKEKLWYFDHIVKDYKR